MDLQDHRVKAVQNAKLGRGLRTSAIANYWEAPSPSAHTLVLEHGRLTRVSVLETDPRRRAVHGHPWLSVGFDSGSRKIVAFVLSDSVPTMVTELELYDQAQEKGIRVDFIETRSRWIEHLAPMSSAFKDNFEPHEDGDIHHMLLDKGVVVRYQPGATSLRMAAERFFGKLKQAFEGGSVAADPSNRSKGPKCCDLPCLAEEVEVFIRAYNHRPLPAVQVGCTAGPGSLAEI